MTNTPIALITILERHYWRLTPVEDWRDGPPSRRTAARGLAARPGRSARSEFQETTNLRLTRRADSRGDIDLGAPQADGDQRCAAIGSSGGSIAAAYLTSCASLVAGRRVRICRRTENDDTNC